MNSILSHWTQSNLLHAFLKTINDQTNSEILDLNPIIYKYPYAQIIYK